jgi:hypothetical protein
MTQGVQGFNPFAGTGGAQIFERGVFLSPGSFKLRIDKCIYKQLNAGGAAFICEMTVLEGKNDVGHEGKDPVGSKRSWFQDLQVQSAKSALKEWAYAACGYDFKNEADRALAIANIDPKCDAILLAACTNGALNTRTIGVETFMKPTKKALKDANGVPIPNFTNHTWRPTDAKLS